MKHMVAGLWQQSRGIWTDPRWRSRFVTATTLASIAALVLMFFQNWHDLSRYDWHYEWLPLLASGLIYSFSLLLVLIGWSVLMRALQVSSTWRQDFKCFISSWLARRLPTPAPYIASRVLLYEEIGVAKSVISVGIVWELLLLVASGGLLCLIISPLAPLVNDRATSLLVILAAVVSIVFVGRPALMSGLANWVFQRLGKPPLMPVIRSPMLALLLLIYAAVWLAGGAMLFTLIRSIYAIEWALFPLILQSWLLSGLLSYAAFFVPVKFLFRDATLAALLSLTIPLSVAIIIVILMRMWVIVNELFWAMVIYRL